MKTINDILPSSKDIKNSQYIYQPELTDKLDNLDTDFNQEIINEIVLWKVNRYSEIPEDTLKLINQIKKTDTQINYELTGAILLKLLSKEQKGIRLPLAYPLCQAGHRKSLNIVLLCFMLGLEFQVLGQ